MLSPCNVYGAGLIMWQLMERQRVIRSQPPYLPEGDIVTLDISDLAKAIYGTHENGLCDLVGQCLRSGPDTRPKVRDLLLIINSELYSEDHDRQQERLNGSVNQYADTLLVPGDDVKLKWASRLLGGAGNVDRTRTTLDPDVVMTGA